MESVLALGFDEVKICRAGAYGNTCGKIWFNLQAVESVFSKTLGFRNKWQRRKQ